MPLLEDGRRGLAESLGPLDVVVGHVGYGLASRFPVAPVTFTFLREPVDRGLSNFSFLQNHPPSIPGFTEDAADFADAAGRTLGEFLRDCPEAASRHVGSVHTWFLTRDGLTPRGDLRALDRSDLEKAKRNLRALDAFGLVERMPESLLLMLSALRTPVNLLDRMPRENRQEERLRSADLDEDTVRALGAACALDMELYEFARSLFEERLDSLRRWASSWLPEFWVSSPGETLAAEKALAASREGVFGRLLAERAEREAALATASSRVEEALAALAAAEAEIRDKTAASAQRESALARAGEELREAREALDEAEADRKRMREAADGLADLIASIRRSASWRVLEALRGLSGRRWNI